MKIMLAAGAITAVMSAPVVHADESQYIAALVQAGISVNDVALEMKLGYGICADITNNGVTGVDNEINYGIKTGMDPYKVGEQVRIAIDNLCPINRAAMMEWVAEHQSHPRGSIE